MERSTPKEILGIAPEVTDGSGTEIEITPAMVEAGAMELALYDSERSSLRDAIFDIWAAMMAARRAS
jgi:hypothetical protein